MRRLYYLCFFMFCCQSSQLLAVQEEMLFIHEQQATNSKTKEFASKYPIVLQHGLFGFRQLFFVEYFHDIPKFLREEGYQVFVTLVHPIGSVAERATELSHQIDEILALTGAPKVNIVGHSMGGLDARYLVAKLGYADKVASISMIATPNQGSYIADLALSTVLQGEAQRRNLLSWVGVDENSDPLMINKAIKAIYNCSQEFIQKHFNPDVKDSPNVFYQSWGGKSSITGFGSGDRLNPLFLLTYPILKLKEGSNDGLVTTQSSKWGLFQGNLPADHLDQIGLFQMSLSPRFRHKRFYSKLAAGLAGRGY